MTLTDNRRFIALISLAAVGDAVIRFSFSKNPMSDIVGVVAACILSVGAIILLKAALDFYRKRSFKNKELISGIIMLFACIPLVWTAFSCCHNFSCFVSAAILDGGPKLIYFLSFLILALIISFMHRNVTLKLGLILFPLTVIFIFLIFGFSAQFMSVKYLMPYKDFSLSGTSPFFLEIAVCLSSLFIPALTLGEFAKKRHFAAAFGIASTLILVCFLNTLLIFGAELSSTLNYPYSYAVSTASLGEIFSRMDGFLYAVCFFTSFLKAAVCLLSAVTLFKKSIGAIFFQKY